VTLPTASNADSALFLPPVRGRSGLSYDKPFTAIIMELDTYILQISAIANYFTEDEVLDGSEQAKLQVRQTTVLHDEEFSAQIPLKFSKRDVYELMSDGMEEAHRKLAERVEDALIGTKFWENGREELWIDYSNAIFTFRSPNLNDYIITVGTF
jgi:hypothetical protein